MGVMTKKVLGSVGSIAMEGFNLYGAYGDYKQARQEGHSVGFSAAKMIGSNLFYNAMGMKGLLMTAGMTAPKIIAGTAGMNGSIGNTLYQQKGSFGSGYFNMSEAGYTMRQRSINAIKNNGLNMQGVFGNEARTYFRSV